MSRPPSDLPADMRLDERWREASRDEPPVALDDAIRAAARQAVHARPRPLSSGPFGGRWRVPLSVAAVVVVSATVTLLIVERERDVLRSPHEVVVAPAGGGPEPHREGQVPAARFSERLDAAPAATPVPREPQAKPAPQAPAEERTRLSPAAAPPAVHARSAAAPAHAEGPSMAEPGAPAAAQNASAAEADAEHVQRTETAAGDAGAVTPAQAMPRSDTRLHDAPAPAGAIPEQLAKRGAQAPAQAKPAGGEVAPAAAGPQARSEEREQVAQAEPRAFPAAPPQEEEPGVAAHGQEPKAWLEQILALRRQGRLKEAERSLKAFRERYPAYPLPAELKSLP